MSLIARPRSEALGAQDAAVAGFSEVNLRTIPRYPFSTERTEHSGQYQRQIQKTHYFYETLIDKMKLQYNS